MSEHDLSRPVATPLADSDFTLSIDEALAMYAKAGLPRTPRSVQRYCAKGHLQGRLIDTGIGEKWLITPESVAKHIAYIEETVATGRDTTRQVATGRDKQDAPAATPREDDKPRQAATGQPTEDRYVSRLESEVGFLRGQIETKDAQIRELTERSRETNHLVAGLQRMLTPLLTKPERRDTAEPPQDAPQP
jgi:hypothetical protein